MVVESTTKKNENINNKYGADACLSLPSSREIELVQVCLHAHIRDRARESERDRERNAKDRTKAWLLFYATGSLGGCCAFFTG